jgi:hypothetical protein
MFKKVFLFAISLGMCTLSFSQGQWGVKGGITRSFVKEGLPAPGTEYALQTGFQFGLFTDQPLTDRITFRPSLQLTQKGYKSVAGNPGGPYYWNRDLSTAYLELPLDLLHRFRLTHTSDVFIGTGPVFSYGWKGRLKAAYVSTDNNQQLHTWISTDKEIFKRDIDRRFDFGWNAGVGVQSCSLLFSLTYNHGIANVIKDEGQALKNRSFAFAVGYFLR